MQHLNKVDATLKRVKHKLLVLSGKGGVGKSTVAVNVAMGLAQEGYSVGLLDIDVHGPSVPAMLGLDGAQGLGSEEGLEPVTIGSLKVMSLGFLLPEDSTPVIWRGPKKMGAIEQLLGDTLWGDLDYLVVDCPPGTGDEPLSIAQLIGSPKALIVTTPQRIATIDVKKSISFCKQLNIRIIGVVENMNGVICPHCNQRIQIFPTGRVQEMCADMGTLLLASLPMDPRVATGADQGLTLTGLTGSPVQEAMLPVVQAVVSATFGDTPPHSVEGGGPAHLQGAPKTKNG